jgi:lipid-A-disaccharide synthase
MTYTLLFSAGETSGDQHAANVFLELKKRQPDIRGIGMGSTKMRQAGIEISYDSSNIGVIGVVEVLKHYPEIRNALKLMQQMVVTTRPDLVICVDYKEFNFKLAKFAKQQGIKVLFYVSPQVWAWRPKRVVKYGKVIDMMAVIFPFETTYYQAENIPVRYVGHPSVDKTYPQRTKAEDLTLFGLNSQQPIVGLLPGSRMNEIKRMLPVMLEAAAKIAILKPQTQFILPQADSVSDALLHSYLSTATVNVRVIKNQPYDVMQCCDAIMTTSGTATLEIALLNVPMVIAYKLSPLTYLLGRLLVNIAFIGLPNIIAGKKIVTELIQDAATAENLAIEINRLLNDEIYVQTMKEALSQVKKRTGKGGGSINLANLALEMLGAKSS